MEPTKEEMTVAGQLATFLETQVRALVHRRQEELLKYVDLISKDAFYIYSTDDSGMIAIKQDADFVAEAVVVSGYPTQEIIYSSVQLSRRGPSLVVTQGQTTITDPLPGVANTTIFDTFAIPLPLLAPASAQPIALSLFASLWPMNVDYLYRCSALWFFPRGDTIQCQFKPDPPTGSSVRAVPKVSLIGRKVVP